ncbi:putative secreted protein [Candidatus Phytoplasma asteris]|uniref:Secreted protein n=1 Tax=Candidatus Phytoplasma asteris TaxID=85620 RepID=A0ABZ2YET1_9MOLU
MPTFYQRKKIFFKILLVLVLFFFITTIAYAIEDWHKLKSDSNFGLKIAAPAELLVSNPEDLHDTNKKFLVPKEHSFLMTTEQTDRVIFEQEATLKTQNNKLTFIKGKNIKLDINYFFENLDLNEQLKKIFNVQIFWKYKEQPQQSFVPYDDKNKPVIIDTNGNLKKIIFQFTIYASEVFPSEYVTKEKKLHIKYRIEKT